MNYDVSSISAPVRFPLNRRMIQKLAIDADWLKEQLEMPGRSQSALARFMGFTSAAIVNRMCKGERTISAEEADKIRAYLSGTIRPNRQSDNAEPSHIGNTPDLPRSDPERAYVSVEVLPTYAGMGGGGTGDGDLETALISRHLVQDELRAKPSDLILINVRGNSMEPHFRHGDQLLVDRRDVSPTQPGPFAVLYSDGYVVKNVAWIERRSKLRLSSSNPEFGYEDFDPDEVKILGRPVWFARRL